MVTIRFYNKISKRLDCRFKLLYCSDYPQFSVHSFACCIFDRSDYSYGQYIAYAKDGRIIAREATYKGV